MEGQNLELENKTETPMQQVPAKVYPAPGTTPDHFYESAVDEEMGIETITYPNGGKSKRAVLSDGRVAITRRIKGKDMIEAGKLANGAQEKVRSAMASVATKIDGMPLFHDDLLNMWSNDFSVINAMSNDLNF